MLSAEQHSLRAGGGGGGRKVTKLERSRLKMTQMNTFIWVFNGWILTDDVVSHESQHFINVDFLDDVPKSFHHVLNTLLTDTLQSIDEKRNGNGMVFYSCYVIYSGRTTHIRLICDNFMASIE